MRQRRHNRGRWRGRGRGQCRRVLDINVLLRIMANKHGGMERTHVVSQ